MNYGGKVPIRRIVRLLSFSSNDAVLNRRLRAGDRGFKDEVTHYPPSTSRNWSARARSFYVAPGQRPSRATAAAANPVAGLSIPSPQTVAATAALRGLRTETGGKQPCRCA